MKPIACVLLLATTPLHAGDEDLARKLANPVAELISIPVQNNLDFGVGPGDGTRWTTNVQPVIPIGIGRNWNLISRTILPLVDQQGIAPAGAADESGLGDTVQSFFFSPKVSDPVWGVGPALLIPTATDELLGVDKWGCGPTAVILKQTGPWTCGALANHLWDVAGDDLRNDVNATFLQPFVSYITDTKTTFTLNSETTYHWNSGQWNIPLNLVVSQLLKIGGQPVQCFVGARAYLDTPGEGPEWGMRIGFTLLFPKS
jgi:hypothetical protein